RMRIDKQRARHIARRTARDARHSLLLAKKHWRLLLIWAVSLGFVFIGGMLLWTATLTIPDLSALENRRIDQSVQIYDRTGQVLLYDLNQNVDRTVVPIASISPNVQAAIIS